jgi:phosphatidylglycerol:prolipoprotein diacylglycerol transferase
MNQAYPLLFTLGALAGLAWLLFVDPRRRAREARRDPDAAAVVRFDAGLAALAGGLIGARLAYVAAHASYFTAHPDQALRFSSGGLSWVGGALGALVGLWAAAALRRRSPWPLADALAIPVALLAMAAWCGCLLDGCAFGRPLASSALAALGSDFFASRIPRWPTQIVGLLAAAGLALGLLMLEGKDLPVGWTASAALLGLGASALALSFARGDPVPLLAGIRADALGAGLITALGVSLGVLSSRTAAT